MGSLTEPGLSRLRESTDAAEPDAPLVHGTLLPEISRELRTPLAAIVAAASCLQTQRGRLPAQEQGRLLDVILDEATSLSNLAENTLLLASLQHARELQFDWQSIEEIVGYVLARVRRRDPRGRIESWVPSGLPLVRADPVLLAQALENLLVDGLTCSTGAIELAVHTAGGFLEVTIKDRGGADGWGRHGAGLRQAVCRTIAEMHGGMLLATRSSLGNSFVLRLPVEGQQPTEATP